MFADSDGNLGPKGKELEERLYCHCLVCSEEEIENLQNFSEINWPGENKFDNWMEDMEIKYGEK